MAVVYPWRALRRGEFARPEGVKAATVEGVSILGRLYKRKWIVSGGIYGSAARGKPSIGSDIDAYIVAAPGKGRHVARYLGRVFKAAMGAHFVDAQIHLTEATEAGMGVQTAEPFYFSHIQKQWTPAMSVGPRPGRFVLINPKRGIETSLTRHGTYLRQYRDYHAQPSTNRMDREKETLKLLSRVLERHIHSSRDVINATGGFPRGKPHDDSASNVVNVYLDRVGLESHAAKAFMKVHDAAVGYKTALHNAVTALDGKNARDIAKARRQYGSAIRTLYNAAPHFETLVRENAKIIAGQRAVSRKPASARTPKR